MSESSLQVDRSYYENERPEVAKLVDADALVILDVGCAMGHLGELLKKQVPGRRVYGVERNEMAAAHARSVLDGVTAGDIQTKTLPFQPATFDCMVFADILEHLTDPAAVLKRLRPLLKPQGHIVCSIPNMRHYAVILRLIHRGWEYEDYGHFDRTHFRFFSLASMKTLLAFVGFSIEHVEPRIVASTKMKLLNAFCLNRLEEFLAFQYLIKARNSSAS